MDRSDHNTCTRCRFWVLIDDTDRPVGTCHRSIRATGEASSVLNGKRIQMAIWKVTNATDWCGDYEVEPSNYWRQGR